MHVSKLQAVAEGLANQYASLEYALVTECHRLLRVESNVLVL
jgi:hypothetical protein